MARNADNYGYDQQQRVTSGPETSGSKTGYSYVNSTGTQPFTSSGTVDGMGIDAMPQPGSTAQLGSEYQGNGALCWVAQVTSSTGTCSNPGGSSTNYVTLSYNSSGDLTGSTAHGYGASSALTWNVDASEPTCINPTGTSCTGPSSSQPQAATYTYNADWLRVVAKTWNSSSSSVVTTNFSWDTRDSALLSSGAFDYLYGQNLNVPIAQIDMGNSIAGELLTDPSSNVRGIVEASSGAANPFVLDNYTDYDAYGNPMTEYGGLVTAGGLTTEGKSGDSDSATNYGFGGGYTDSSNSVYLLHRFVDTSLGQFLSVDPLAILTSPPYAYAGDDPMSHVDPSGGSWIPSTPSSPTLSKGSCNGYPSHNVNYLCYWINGSFPYVNWMKMRISLNDTGFPSNWNWIYLRALGPDQRPIHATLCSQSSEGLEVTPNGGGIQPGRPALGFWPHCGLAFRYWVGCCLAVAAEEDSLGAWWIGNAFGYPGHDLKAGVYRATAYARQNGSNNKPTGPWIYLESISLNWVKQS